MRLSLKINSVSQYTASVSGPGYLSAHINLHNLPNTEDYSQSIRIQGSQTLETETTRFEWPKLELNTHDVVEITLLESGDGDAPDVIKRSSESPRNLFSRTDLAKELLAVVSDFETRLMKVVDEAERTEPAAERTKLAQAVGRVSMELGDSLLYPIYRRHPELIPERLKGELL
jgi:hypothetical protein